MKFNFKSWKTTLAGAIAIFIQLGPVLFPKYITPQIANTISTTAGALGLLAAKDSNVTGGSVVNVPNSAAAVKTTASKTTN